MSDDAATDAMPVFPTPVGMDRWVPPTRRPGASFSPRPWGWTGPAVAARHPRRVFPTPVGMDREGGAAMSARRRFPHARGDGPFCRAKRWRATRFSPRPWGWTGGLRGAAHDGPVFPTPVGMDRTFASGLQWRGRFPHARGDGPLRNAAGKLTPVFSPRPWGWTGISWVIVGGESVFPTPVGMDRLIINQP